MARFLAGQHVHMSRDEHGRQCLTIHCASCRHEFTATLKPGISPLAVIQSARHADWVVDSRAKSPECPHCRRKSMNTEPSTEALKKQRKLFALLDEHFDADAGRYADGWGDDRIASETNLSPAAVAKARDAAYGPIKVDPRIAELANDLAILKQQRAAEVGALTEMIKQADAKFLERVAALDARLARLLVKAA